ncbi:MAG: hypothetical protein IJL88_01785 [Clostridia bacterium]|nr:hypothetical protein [Clostridia bacterium]
MKEKEQMNLNRMVSGEDLLLLHGVCISFPSEFWHIGISALNTGNPDLH